MKTVPHRMTLLDETHRGILQAYDIHYQESVVYQSFPLHWHVFYELELVVSGSGVQWINGHAMRLEPGSFYLLSPTDMHRIIANEPLSFYSVKVPSDKLPAVLKNRRLAKVRSLHNCPVKISQCAAWIFIGLNRFYPTRRLMANPMRRRSSCCFYHCCLTPRCQANVSYPRWPSIVSIGCLNISILIFSRQSPFLRSRTWQTYRLITSAHNLYRSLAAGM